MKRRFRQVAIGEQFRFAGESHPVYGSDFAKGPWIKTGPRRYRHAAEPWHLEKYGKSDLQVGSINAEVSA